MSFTKRFKSTWSQLTILGKPLIVLWCGGYCMAALSDGADVMLPKIGTFLNKLFFKQ